VSALPTCGVERAAELLLCHHSTVLELARAGKLRGRKAGRAWVFVEADILQYIREGECRSTKEDASGGSMSPPPNRPAD
jgi:excisionase family DNA binding protein